MVGFGVHGMNTAISGSPSWSSFWLISVSFSLATKTSDQTPLRGYSTSPTWRNMSPLFDSTVSKICFSEP